MSAADVGERRFTTDTTDPAAADIQNRPESPSTMRNASHDWWLWPIVGTVATIGIWAFLTDVVFASRALVPEFSPTRTWQGLTELVGSGALVNDASASVLRLLIGLAIGIVGGVLIGLALGSARWLERASRPTLHFLRMVSPLSWAPLAIALLGVGSAPVAALVAAATIWPMALATASGVSSVDRGLLAVARSLGASSAERFRTVTLPSIRPQVLGGIRLAIGIGWVVLVPAEMLGVTSGLGYQILNAKDQLAYHHITALIVVIGLIGLSLDVVAQWLLQTPRQRHTERQN